MYVSYNCFIYVPGAETGGEKRRRDMELWKVFPSKLHTSSVVVNYLPIQKSF